MANGDLIKQVRQQLDDPDGISTEAAVKLTLSLLADLYEKWQEDHKKTEAMWPGYKFAVWAAGILGAADLAFFIGIVTHTVHFP